MNYKVLDKITVPKSLLEDRRLSNGAKFLFILLCFEQDKKIEVRHLVKIIDRSPQTIRLWLRRLAQTGWVTPKDKRYECHMQ